MAIPVVDLAEFTHGTSEQKASFVQSLGKAYEEVGFVVLEIDGSAYVMTYNTGSGQYEYTDFDTAVLGVAGNFTYNVTVDFDALDPRIKPEMSVSASIITDVKQDVLTVPSSAVKIQNGTNYVEVLNGATPEQKNVTVGASNGTDTEITSGIKAGDRVVTQTIDAGAAGASSSNSSNRSGSSSSIRIPGLGGGR